MNWCPSDLFGRAGIKTYVLETICSLGHIGALSWVVNFHDEFVPEYGELEKNVQDELLAIIEVIEQMGPHLGRPRVDTLNDSKYKNMKEIRFNAADASPSRSTPNDRRLSFAAVTNQAEARSVFISSLSQKPMNVLGDISKTLSQVTKKEG